MPHMREELMKARKKEDHADRQGALPGGLFYASERGEKGKKKIDKAQ